MQKKWTLKKIWHSKKVRKGAAIVLIVCCLIGGALALWVATLKMPDLSSLNQQVLSESTKIYDKTGETLLYNVNQDLRRTVVPFDQISPYLKNATVAIEDSSFYTHGGIKISSIIRAVFADLLSGEYSQGGSTITQQVIKNSLLTTDKSIPRKIKEWVLAIKLERIADKDTILNLYLNGTPYGGNYYGVEEASQAFFGKSAKDVDIAEAAYIAAVPQAPSYYSPYGSHRADLDTRKNVVLQRMKDLGFIGNDQYEQARKEVVVFKKQGNASLKAPHFVEFVENYLEQKYGSDAVLNGGLKVITSLDFDLQQDAEEVIGRFATTEQKQFNASNQALVAIDPTTGGILAMVGSRDYFDKTIDGNFNVTLAHRQPGSSFKPFVYATAFEKGYTPDTVLFDAETEFAANCDASQPPVQDKCYRPQNYDGKYRGPMSLRDALAESINVPAVKLLYLAGVTDSIKTASDMGIQKLGDVSQYGLTLVLGGGEVSPLDMASAYGVFANDGVRNPYVSVLKVTDRMGNVLEEYKPTPIKVLEPQIARQITDILTDNTARTPAYGANSALYIPDRPVAVKTGTTNDTRDAWTLGYTPQIAVAVWAGNNDNSPMVKNVAGLIVAPIWRAFMDEALKKYPIATFQKPDPVDQTLKPILRGVWQAGYSYVVDTATGKTATDSTPVNQRQTITVPSIHTILYSVNKDDPQGPPPANPANDPEYIHWEYGVQKWLSQNNLPQGGQVGQNQSSGTGPSFSILTPQSGTYDANSPITVRINYTGQSAFTKVEYYVNGNFIDTEPMVQFNFTPSAISGIRAVNTLRLVAYDSTGARSEQTVSFQVTGLQN